MKQTIAIYLRNYVRKLIDKNANIKARGNTWYKELIYIFYKALIAETLEFSVKKHINLIFESLLQIYQTFETE